MLRMSECAIITIVQGGNKLIITFSVIALYLTLHPAGDEATLYYGNNFDVNRKLFSQARL